MSRHAFADTVTLGRDWLHRAACRETDTTGQPAHDPDLWFPDGTTGHWQLVIEDAKRVCYRCPVMELCGQWARETGQEYGVFGGLSEDERRAMKRRRADRRTAPRPEPEPEEKTPAPTLVFARVGSLAEQCRDLYARYTEPRDGHLVWTAQRTQVSVAGRDRTYAQISFQAGHGRWPDGPVKRSCQVWKCVAPECLTDRAMRTARKRAAERVAAAAGVAV